MPKSLVLLNNGLLNFVMGDDGSHYLDCENIVQEFLTTGCGWKKVTDFHEFLIRRKAELAEGLHNPKTSGSPTPVSNLTFYLVYLSIDDSQPIGRYWRLMKFIKCFNLPLMLSLFISNRNGKNRLCT